MVLYTEAFCTAVHKPGENTSINNVPAKMVYVPAAYAYSRFMEKIMAHEAEVEAIFDTMVEQLSELLPDSGKSFAIDGKAVESFAKGNKKHEEPDGRRDTDADVGKKKYWGKRKDGTIWEKVVEWFGYKLQLLVDAIYELPVAYSVTKASVPDINAGHAMVNELEQERPWLLEEAETLAGDRGYDDTRRL